jgi:DNA invertase Pin-like site-specific DNA recombinase
MQDMATKERSGSTRLSADQVRAIRADGRTYGDIADTYSISRSMVYKIKARISWRQVS